MEGTAGASEALPPPRRCRRANSLEAICPKRLSGAILCLGITGTSAIDETSDVTEEKADDSADDGVDDGVGEVVPDKGETGARRLGRGMSKWLPLNRLLKLEVLRL